MDGGYEKKQNKTRAHNENSIADFLEIDIKSYIDLIPI